MQRICDLRAWVQFTSDFPKIHLEGRLTMKVWPLPPCYTQIICTLTLRPWHIHELIVSSNDLAWQFGWPIIARSSRMGRQVAHLWLECLCTAHWGLLKSYTALSQYSSRQLTQVLDLGSVVLGWRYPFLAFGVLSAEQAIANGSFLSCQSR